MTNLCAFCHELLNHRVRSLLIDDFDYENKGSNFEDRPTHHQRIYKISNFDATCNLCILVKAQRRSDSSIEEFSTDCFSEMKSHASIQFFAQLSEAKEYYDDDDVFFLEAQLTEGELENAVVASDNTMSTESLEKLRSWIDQCDNHHDCHHWPRINGVPRSIPSRLLDMDLSSGSNPPKIRLVTSSEITEHEPCYATLSHCWGGTLAFRLLQTNISEMTSEIVFEKLAKTFQEAIFLTRKLQIPYLWIDALCIIQDSFRDWSEQASLMEQVYSNSYLNISATDSADGTGGLSRDRNPEAVQSVYIPSSPNHEEKKKAPGILCLHETRLIGPVDERAWVLQERFLSPRTIHYIHNQLGWECSELTTSEGLPLTINLPQNSVNLFKSLNKSISAPASNGNEKYENIWILWDNLVIRYMSGSLTKPSDRAIAITGVARVIARHLHLQPSDFHSGLWRPRFADGLAWYSLRTTAENFSAEVIPGIPSWSWLSANVDTWQDHTGRDFKYTTPIDVLEVRTTHINDLFGPVQSTLVRIKSPMCKVRISERVGSQDLVLNPMNPLYDLVLDDTMFLEGSCLRVHWDAHRGRTLKSVLDNDLCLLLARAGEMPVNGPASLHLTYKYGYERYLCLILAHIPQPMIPHPKDPPPFHRLGLIKFEPPFTKEEDHLNNEDSKIRLRVYRKLDECFAKQSLSEDLYEDVDEENKYTITLV